ncbi:MAG: T9SS type A sorting domain-containing protein, partial [Sphingobacteriales bacterium]
NVWVGPNPLTPLNAVNRFALTIPATNVKYIVVNTSGAYPTEMEIYGYYVPPAPIADAPQKEIKLKQMMGVNAFEWDFENPNSPLVIDTARLRAAKSFTGIRHYIDWEKLELTEGNYTFNPCHSGGWNYDTLYATCKAQGIEVLADIKTIPAWMMNTYPSADRDLENVPVKYGMDFANPTSYLGQAKVAFQFAARYGSNNNVSSTLLSVNPATRWNNDPMNVVKKGLGYIKYMECDNERDKWWKGRKAYQTAREYAANMSAFYDGHKGTMGPGAGVKNADPNMIVVMGGVAATSTDYLKGMVDWCKEFRGYNADGSVNLCWDVINYHIYANDGQNSQSGNSTRGAAPEVALADTIAKSFLDAAHIYCKDMPVWITETGYDVNQSSPLKAIAIGNKTVLQTQADWILRTALLYARAGIDRVFFYQMYDDNIASSTKFASSGLINANRTRKPAADYIYQATRLMGDYTFKQTLSVAPFVDRYELNGKSAYVLVKGSENGSTVSYTLNLGAIASAKVYTPAIGQDSMNVQIVQLVNGNLTLTVGETPTFVIPIAPAGTQNKMGIKTSETAAGNDWAASVKLYPNPAKNYINVAFSNNEEGDINIRILNVAGQVMSKTNFNKEAGSMTEAIDLSFLQTGLYLVEVMQGRQKTVKTIFKEN